MKQLWSGFLPAAILFFVSPVQAEEVIRIELSRGSGHDTQWRLQRLEQAVDQLQRQKRHATAQREVWLRRRNDASPGDTADAERLQQALFALPPEQLAIIRLHVYDEFTFREASEILEAPLQTLISRYHAGLRQLKEKLHVR